MMTPSIFVSSTIVDLADMRNRIRSYIESIGFIPVMSEHAEVPYLPSLSSTASCYSAVQKCNMLILLIGRRFGSTEDSGESIVQLEHRAAAQAGIPVFALVDRDVITAKSIYESSQKNPDAKLPGTDDPAGLYKFIDQVIKQNTNNGIITFNDSEDAIIKLRKQIAGYIGNLISDDTGPVASRLEDIYADVKAIRTRLDDTPEDSDPTTDPTSPVPLKILSKLYRQLFQYRFSSLRDIVAAIDSNLSTDPYPHLVDCEGWIDFLKSISVPIENINPTSESYRKIHDGLLNSGKFVLATGVTRRDRHPFESYTTLVSNEPRVYQEPGAADVLDSMIKELQSSLS